MNCVYTCLSYVHLRYTQICCHAVQETAFKITEKISDNICVVRATVCRAKYSKIKIGGIYLQWLWRGCSSHI